MVWTPIKTWPPNQIMTAAEWNLYVRDNLNFLRPAVFDDGLPKAGFSTFSRTTADATKTSDTTLADVTGLSFSIGASETWTFEYYLFVNGPTAGDIKVAINFPAGTVLVRYAATTTNDASVGSAKVATASGGVLPVNLFAVEELLLFSGVVVNGATAGTVQLQFAQGASNATSTIIRTDSHVLARRVRV